jgi:hypothetical protein
MIAKGLDGKSNNLSFVSRKIKKGTTRSKQRWYLNYMHPNHEKNILQKALIQISEETLQLA